MRTKHFLYVVIFVGIICAVVFLKKLANRIDPSAFYTVFLDNQQVYFGHIRNLSQDSLVLEDVYYLKSVAKTSQEDAVAEATSTAKISLIKLGNEFHNPKDSMVINRSHILFYEEMSSDGTIFNEILDYEKHGEKQ